MTILRFEPQTLLRVLEAPSGSSSSCEVSSIPSDDDEFVVVNIPKPFLYVDYVPCSTCDGDSICTSSTSSESISTDSSLERRVSFAPSLVTDEWTRPYTPKEEISNLYYSTEETNRFRQEYRLERKVLNELSIGPDVFPEDNEEISTLIATTSGCQQPCSRHRISRVVVLHNDKLETFFNPDEKLSQTVPMGDFFDNDSFWSGSLTWY